jgi:hypothetical protein
MHSEMVQQKRWHYLWNLQSGKVSLSTSLWTTFLYIWYISRRYVNAWFCIKCAFWLAGFLTKLFPSTSPHQSWCYGNWYKVTTNYWILHHAYVTESLGNRGKDHRTNDQIDTTIIENLLPSYVAQTSYPLVRLKLAQLALPTPNNS